jgi:hypothetical protein
VLERGFIDPVRTISLSTRVRIANSPKSAALRRRQSAAVLLAIFLTSGVGLSQPSSETVKIEVHANQADGAFPSVWNFFGYDEPNYTYAPNGTKLLNELSALSPSPVYVRVHNLLTTGDGTASLKWGSTNVYTEDAAGNPQYSWAIVDRIFDAFQAAGVKPLVEIGFMPEALSTHPQPYRHNFPQESAGGIFTGWAYPPNDYQKWSDLVFKFVQHLRNRYGDEGIHTWLWEVWNEPDIPYWKGTPEEFFKLYDVSVTPSYGPSQKRALAVPIPRVLPTRRRQNSCGSSSNTALTERTTQAERSARTWISSRFIPKAHLPGKPITCRWGLIISWLRSTRVSRLSPRFPNGVGRPSFLANRIPKAVRPVRLRRIHRTRIETVRYMGRTPPKC